jgi:IclR family pca regulon transcriptional regulator
MTRRIAVNRPQKRATKDGPPKERPPEGMAGLAKGLAVLEAFEGRETLTISQTAEITRLSRAAARRCLLTLADLGYLSGDGKFFRPTPRTLRMGAIYLEATPLPRLAQPYLTEARDQLQESVSLAVLHGDWAIFVARAEAQRIVSSGVRVGARLPAWCSATGRVLLAALPQDELDLRLATVRLEQRTPHTVDDRAELRRRIAAAGRDGLAVLDEEIELGMRAMAVPVHDSQGRVLAALSVSAFAARVSTEALREDYRPVLQSIAAELGRRL